MIDLFDRPRRVSPQLDSAIEVPRPIVRLAVAMRRAATAGWSTIGVPVDDEKVFCVDLFFDNDLLRGRFAANARAYELEIQVISSRSQRESGRDKKEIREEAKLRCPVIGPPHRTTPGNPCRQLTSYAS